VTIDLDEITVEQYSDGNPNFWVEDPKILKSNIQRLLLNWYCGILHLFSFVAKIMFYPIILETLLKVGRI
jgi:hypothetical protein